MNPQPSGPKRPTWQIEVFFDGDCPLCRREIAMLLRFDRRDRVLATDIAADGFRPSDYGRTMSDFMEEIRGRLPNGEWVQGVECFRRLYAAIGLGPLVALTRLPGLSGCLEWSYRVFARNRLRLTGRCDAGACQIDSTNGIDPALVDRPQRGSDESLQDAVRS